MVQHPIQALLDYSSERVLMYANYWCTLNCYSYSFLSDFLYTYNEFRKVKDHFLFVNNPLRVILVPSAVPGLHCDEL